MFENQKVVKKKLRKFKVIDMTSDLTDKILDEALSFVFSDFEDALQYPCVLNMDCNILITENVKDFKESELPVMTIDE